jgi:hypothetical protein
MEFPIHADYTWWVKWYAVLVITDEGVFAESEVPEDYGGPQLKAEVIQRVVFATENGYLWENRYDDIANVMDKNRKKGMGVDVQPFEEVWPYENIEATGPSDLIMPWYVRENPAFANVRAKLLKIALKVVSAPL